MVRDRVIAGLIVLAGLINFAPLIGVFSAARIESLYSVKLADPTLEILLRHRAVLFGLVGGFMVFAAFRRHLQLLAIIGGLTAMLSFLWLYYFADSPPRSLLSIIYADIVGIVLLVGALLLIVSREGR